MVPVTAGPEKTSFRADLPKAWMEDNRDDTVAAAAAAAGGGDIVVAAADVVVADAADIDADAAFP